MKRYTQSVQMAPNRVLMGWFGIYDLLTIIYIMRQYMIYADKIMTPVQTKIHKFFRWFYDIAHPDLHLFILLKLLPHQPDLVCRSISHRGTWA